MAQKKLTKRSLISGPKSEQKTAGFVWLVQVVAQLIAGIPLLSWTEGWINIAAGLWLVGTAVIVIVVHFVDAHQEG